MSPLAMDEDSRRRFASRWIRLGDPGPETLLDARLQLHWAVQLLAAFGEAFVPARPDDSHSALTWSPERRAFLSEPSVDGSALRLGLEPSPFTYRLFGPGPTGSDPFELQGRTLDQAARWLVAELEERIDGAAAAFRLSTPDIPGHRVGRGAAFDPSPPELAELERWFHDGYLLLEEVAGAEEGASPVRCWPHHFDIAVLIDVGGDEAAARPDDPDDDRSIGVGMTPGDDDFEEPYLYVSPWPYPEPEALPNLQPPATWYTGDWVGAVLTGPELVGVGDGLAQANRAASFAGAAIAGCRALLRNPGP